MEYDPTKKKPQNAAASDKKMTPVVEGAKIKKRTGVSKASKAFLEEDINTVKDNLVHNYVIPGVKNLLYSVLTNAIGMSLFGQNGNPQNKGNGYGYGFTSANRINYSNYSGNGMSRQATFDNSGIGAGFNYEDIIYPTAGAAERVLDSLQDAIDRYGQVSVADLYDLSDITVENPQTTKYGWVRLGSAKVIKLLGGGFALSMPRPRPID